MIASERLEALAKARDVRCRLSWNAETEDCREDWRRWATAALRHLGSVDENGEVIVPEEGALGKAREALEAVLNYDAGTNIMSQRLCPVCGAADEEHDDDCPIPKVADALRALGVSDE